MTIIGMDDTDSRTKGMCTTYVGHLVANKLKDQGFSVEDVHLIRLNPAAKHKTRGNAAVSITTDAPAEMALSITKEIIFEHAVEDDDTDIDEFFNNSSGLINEGNFEINDDQTILLRFPWIGVAFFGENAVVINSVDSNLADLARSEELQLGGSTLPPGEIPNLIYNVEGGIGVFGSIASDTLITTFTRPNTE